MQTHTIFVAVKEAFNYVDRNLLFETVQNRYMPNQFVKAVRNMYKKNLITVKFGTEYSEWKPVNQGARKG